MLVPVLTFRGYFLADIPAPDLPDHLHPGLSCSQIPVRSVTHLLAVAVAAAGACYLLQVFVHRSQRRQSVTTVTTTISGTTSFTSLNHTRTRTTLHTHYLNPFLLTRSKQAAPLPCGRYTTFETLGSASRTSSLTH